MNLKTQIEGWCHDFLEGMDVAMDRLQAFPQDHWMIHYGSFPKGSCGDASELFAVYLHEIRGVAKWRIELTRQGCCCGRSHAWNFVDGLYVDVTASQFPGMPKVVVLQRSDWHERFKDYYRLTFEEAVEDGDCRHEKILSLLKDY